MVRPMDVSLFDFVLPESAIALRPVEPRDHARLLEINPGLKRLESKSHSKHYSRMSQSVNNRHESRKSSVACKINLRRDISSSSSG